MTYYFSISKRPQCNILSTIFFSIVQQTYWFHFNISLLNNFMAERPGFEPGVGILSLQRFSKPSLSAAQPPLRLFRPLLRYVFLNKRTTDVITTFVHEIRGFINSF